MRVAIAAALLALAASASAQSVFIASVVDLKTPLPAGVAGKPEVNRSALSTIAEQNQNATTGITNFIWELVYTPAPAAQPFPVKYELVAYTPGGNPANGAVILTFANNPAGLAIDTPDVQGNFTLQQLNAGRAAAGLPNATACEAPAGCTPGPGAAIKFGDRMLYVLTFSDGGIIAGQAVDALPDSFYPEPSNDGFYLADFNNLTIFAIGGLPALITPVDSLFFDVYDNFDGSWGLDLLTTIGVKKLTSVKIVALVGGAPVTVLDLSRRIDFNSPLLDDTGFALEKAFTDAELVAGMKAAGLSQTTELLGAVTIADGATTYTNYAKFDPQWFRTPATPSPPPPAKKPSKPSKPAPKPSKPSPVGPAGKCATKSNATIPSQFNLGKPAQAATPAACCARCAAVTACKGWTLNTKGACQLKTSGATQYESNYSSGSK